MFKTNTQENDAQTQHTIYQEIKANVTMLIRKFPKEIPGCLGDVRLCQFFDNKPGCVFETTGNVAHHIDAGTQFVLEG